MKFLTVVAWIFAVLSTGLITARVVGFFCYSERDKLQDHVRGFEKSYPVVWPGVVAIICWAWIAAGGL